MGQALYRKYRSRNLDEIVGQEHITDTLRQALKAGRISHAYLFTGPRGVGKTSIARILAHELNGLSYDDEQSHLDIIEIDAASNNGVEDVRDLREKVYIAPTSGKYKVYIIDEVHMLSKAAFNALLKTLEEPPAHVVFILATTEVHKLPETIISRTQRYLFRPIDPKVATEHLRHIAKTEKITISDDALALLAAHGDGSFRDSISLLDQASGLGKKIELSDVQMLLGIPPADAIGMMAVSLVAGNATVNELLGQLYGLYSQGFQAAAIAKSLGQSLRELLLTGKTSVSSSVITGLLAKLLDVPISHDPERYLEICLLEATSDQVATPTPVVAPAAQPKPIEYPLTKATPQPTPKVTKSEPAKASPVAEAPSVAEQPPEPSAIKATPVSGSEVLDETLWTSVLNELKKQYNTLYSVARMAKPDFSTPGKIILSCNFAFHQKRLHEAKNRKLIGDIIQQLSGQEVEVDAVHDPEVKLTTQSAATPVVAAAPSGDMSAISNIFGGGELLNS